VALPIAGEAVESLELSGAQFDAIGGGVSSTRATRFVPGIGAMSLP
jgi:hypothetical protein